MQVCFMYLLCRLVKHVYYNPDSNWTRYHTTQQANVHYCKTLLKLL